MSYVPKTFKFEDFNPYLVENPLLNFDTVFVIAHKFKIPVIKNSI